MEKKMENEMQELTIKDLEAAQGAGGAEAKVFIQEMLDKYGVPIADDAFDLMTRQEVQHFWDLYKGRC